MAKKSGPIGPLWYFDVYLLFRTFLVGETDPPAPPPNPFPAEIPPGGSQGVSLTLTSQLPLLHVPVASTPLFVHWVMTVPLSFHLLSLGYLHEPGPAASVIELNNKLKINNIFINSPYRYIIVPKQFLMFLIY